MGSRGDLIRRRLLLVLFVIAGGLAAYYRFVYLPGHRIPAEVAYVLPESLVVVDSPAEVRIVIGSLRRGERVEVRARTRHWVRLRLPDGGTGWVEAKDLLDSPTYEAGQRLLKELLEIPPQAVGHTTGRVNLRVEPSRDAPQLAQLAENRRVEIFRRRLVDRPPREGSVSPPGVRDAWYLIRSDARAGWVLGRLISLDIPEEITMYAQDMNLVAWLVLNTVDDGGRPVPQYLVADRVRAPEFDFNHIRVFTWWAKRQQYVTAYVESGLNGHFPIRLLHKDNIPHFRLRLVDRRGRKFQKVYRMLGTIVRPLGIVEGWESEAMPTRPVSKAKRARLSP